MQDIERTIRERAYQIWIESGRQHGNADGHWLPAQREVVGASLGLIARVSPAKKQALRAKGSSRKKDLPRPR
jgi:hypothetical protein